MEDKEFRDIVQRYQGTPLDREERDYVRGLVGAVRRHRLTRRSFIAKAAVVGLSMTAAGSILAACGDDEEEEVALTPTAAPPEATPTETPAAATPTAPPTAEKLIITEPVDMDTLDVQAFKSIPGYYTQGNLYDQLIDLAAVEQQDGLVLKVVDETAVAPMVARSMEVSPDRLTVTFKLDPTATFENGDPVTVEDVVYTFSRGVLGAQYTNILVVAMLQLTSVDNISTPDSETVVFKLDKPNPMTERLMSLQVMGIQSKKAGEANATAEDPFADAFWRENIIGNSAYRLKEWRRGEGWELEPNPNYYKAAQGLPRNAGLIYRIVPDAAERLALVKAGEVHVSFEVSAKDAISVQEAGGNAVLLQDPMPWNFMLTFNNTLEPFTDVRVRQALSFAVPYDTIINEVMRGLARPSRSIIVPGMPTSDQSFWKYDTNLEEAKRLLEAAGFPDGFDTSIDVLVGRSEDEEMATFIQANFREIGVNAEVRVLAEAQFYQGRNEATTPMQIAEWFSWVNDPMYHMFWNLLGANTFTNTARYNNPEFDAIVLEGMYEPDLEKREALSKQAQEIAVNEAPWAFLFARDYFVPVAKNIRNFPIWPDHNPRFYWTSLA